MLLTSAGDTSFSMATLASTLLYRAILFQQSGYQSFRRVAVAAESPSTPGTLNTKIEWKWGWRGGEAVRCSSANLPGIVPGNFPAANPITFEGYFGLKI